MTFIFGLLVCSLNLGVHGILMRTESAARRRLRGAFSKFVSESKEERTVRDPKLEGSLGADVLAQLFTLDLEERKEADVKQFREQSVERVTSKKSVLDTKGSIAIDKTQEMEV
jgi:hypothetical protein